MTATTTEERAPTASAVPTRRRRGLSPERVKEFTLLGLIVVSLVLFNTVIENYEVEIA